jgi:hypothetical protein
MTDGTMSQRASYPTALAELVRRLFYKRGWLFTLEDLDRGQGSIGLTLVITVATVNSYNPGEPLTVAHYMPVPPAAYDGRSWQRWLFEQVLLVERHEAAEFFRLAPSADDGHSIAAGGGGWRPYAPSHGPGNDPYLVREVGTIEDVRTSFRGELNE